MKKMGIRFKDIDNQKTAVLKLAPETAKKLFPKNNQKKVNDYIIDYLGEKLFDEIQEEWDKCFNKSLPKGFKESCIWCTSKIKKEEDKKCASYNAECSINYFFAATEFVRTVENNKELIKGYQLKRELTVKFFECFTFQGGRVTFDLEKMTFSCLRAGFYTLSNILSENKPLQSLSMINESIDNLNTEKLRFDMLENETPIHIDPQLKFFKNKQIYFKEKHFIEKEKSLVLDSEVTITKKDRLNSYLNDYGFFELEILKDKKLNFLIEHLAEKKAPYQIAYLEHLGFNKYVLSKYCKTERELQKILAKVLEISPRTIRGHLNVLKNPHSGDSDRYKAHLHSEEVKKHFKKII